MKQEIYITGMGMVSAIGNNVHESFISLKSSKTGIDKIKFLQTRHCEDFKVGEVNMSNSDLLLSMQITEKEYVKYSRTALLGMKAAKEAFENAKLQKKDLTLRIGVVSATTVGGMDKTENDYADMNIKTGFVQTHPSGDSTDKIAEFLGIMGYRTTLSTACSSAANAIMHGANLIQHNLLDIALVGGTDALSKFTLNGFNALMILDKDFCKTFDKNRQGLNLGEGAGFLVIESAESIKKRGVSPIAELVGYANANDAYHQTASSPEGEGAYISMQKAIRMSKLLPENIDYINVHGTGTFNNDLSEGIAMKRLFGNQLPPFSSTKSFTGHTLGASAGVESVISILAISNNMIFPNLNFFNPIEELQISPITKVIDNIQINNVLSNSFGFGGNNSTLIFRKY